MTSRILSILLLILLSCDSHAIKMETVNYDILSKSILIIENEILLVKATPPIDPNDKTNLNRYVKFCDTISYYYKTIDANLSKQVLEGANKHSSDVNQSSSDLLINNKKINTHFPISIFTDTLLQNMHYRNCSIRLEHPIITQHTAFVGAKINMGTKNYSEYVILFEKKGDDYNWKFNELIELGYR